MSRLSRTAVSVDVSAIAPAGCQAVDGELYWVPGRVSSKSPIVVCFPGGGMSRMYFDLPAPGYSMAAHLAERGMYVLTLDHPGTGGSDIPDDPWSLTPEVVADVDSLAVRQALLCLSQGEVAGVGSIRPELVVGLGHSAGALVVIHMQARNGAFDCLGLLGWSGYGLPEHLSSEEWALSCNGLEAESLVAAAQRRYPAPLVDLPRRAAGTPSSLDRTEEADVALLAARSRLLAVLGLASMIPGSARHAAEGIEVAILLAVGEHDIAHSPLLAPTEFPRCRDMTVLVLERSGHNHNVAPTRVWLWNRLVAWVRAQGYSTSYDREAEDSCCGPTPEM